MVALSEQAVFETEVRRAETTDLVLGGAPNPATGESALNIIGLQLANRTRWLKDQVDALSASIAALTGAEILARLLPFDGAGSILDSDTVDGLHAAAFWKASDSPALIAAIGYQVFPSGLIVQWGNMNNQNPGVVSLTTTLPMAFPTFNAAVLVTDSGTTGNFFAVTQKTLSSFTTETSEPGDNTATWFAIGA